MHKEPFLIRTRVDSKPYVCEVNYSEQENTRTAVTIDMDDGAKWIGAVTFRGYQQRTDFLLLTSAMSTSADRGPSLIDLAISKFFAHKWASQIVALPDKEHYEQVP